MLYTLAPNTLLNRVDSASELVESARQAAIAAKPHAIKAGKAGLKAGKYTAIFIGCIIVLFAVTAFLMGRVASQYCNHLVESSIDPTLTETVEQQQTEKTDIEEALINASNELVAMAFDTRLMEREVIRTKVDALTLRQLRPICGKLEISQNQPKVDLQRSVFDAVMSRNLNIDEVLKAIK